MTSIRRRLIASLALGLVLLLAAGGAAVHQVVRARTHARFERDLEGRARALAAALEIEIGREALARATALGLEASAGSGASAAARRRARAALLALARETFRVRLALDPAALPEYRPGDDAAYFVIEAGAPPRVVAASPSWEGAPRALDAGALRLPDGRPGRAAATTSRVRFRDARWGATWEAIAGEEGRALTTARVTVARGVADRDAFLRTVRDGLVLGGLFVVLGVALVAWLVVRRGLRPLEALSQHVAALEVDSLEKRLPTAGMPTELAPVVERLNEALGRIEGSVARERRTAAHVAHELRTPLAELTTITELAARWPDDPEIAARAARDGHAIAAHMTRVVSALLKVARAESGQEPITTEPFDLAAVVDDAWQSLAATAAARGHRFERDLPTPLEAVADREIAEAVVGSLLGNAVQHAPRGSTIRCGATARDGEATVWIENPAPGLDPADVEEARALFWRKDPARTPSEHAGLGLSVASALARAAGLRLVPGLEGGTFRVEVALPAA